ncbi:hypothetical protein BDA99DRAFT_219092 [Phascolomyces articulosus]|uniref:Uncharacterized protein n=1 Tax=Phascolomyces articulosus TaxID=60185 RepID=A0AAD5K0H5_9FUNG|nr:hypothetical protein BDA99DRAFT_219092 [Phascolomyces articulosus]
MLSTQDVSNSIYTEQQQRQQEHEQQPQSMAKTDKWNTISTDNTLEQRSLSEENDTTTTKPHDFDANFDTPTNTTTTTVSEMNGNGSSSRLHFQQNQQSNSSQITLPFSDSGGSSHHDDPPLPLQQQQQQQQKQQQSTSRYIMRRPSDESIRSNFSTTSSVFSTASKIARLPHAVKNSFVSVKDFMKSNRSRAKRLTISHSTSPQPPYVQDQSTGGSSSPHSSHFSPQTIHYSTPGTSPYSSDRESLASRFRRRTPSTMGLSSIFSNNNNKDERYSSSTTTMGTNGNATGASISPSASTSYSILEVKDPHHKLTTPTKPRQRNLFSSGSGNSNGRRNSVVGAATRFLKRDDHSKQQRISAINEENAKTPTSAEFGFSNEFEQAIQQKDGTPSTTDQKAVGKLLFGVDLDHMEFFENDLRKSATSSTISATYDLESTVPSSDAKSDHITTSKSSTHEVVWSRQRAKSCQETKVPSLRQLAKGQYASTAALSSHHHHTPPSPPPPIPSLGHGDHDPIPFKPNLLPIATATSTTNGGEGQGHQHQRILTDSKLSHSYNTILVTATLTTLHSKLISDCDQLLASTLLSPSKQKNKPKFPEDQLRAIMNDLRKMSDMVEWEDGEGPVSKKSVAAFFQVLGQQISQGQSFVDAAESNAATNVANNKKDKKQQRMAQMNTTNQALTTAVRDIVSCLKQMVNQCVCQYHKVFEKSMIIPCKGYRIEGRNRFGTQAQDYTDPTLDPKDYNDSIVEYMDHEAYWYRNYFMGRNYTTFVGYVDDSEPSLLSAICETPEDSAQKQYRLIIRTKQVN